MINSKTTTCFLWLIALQLSSVQSLASSRTESTRSSDTAHVTAFQIYQELKRESSGLLNKYSSTKDNSFKLKINRLYDKARKSSSPELAKLVAGQLGVYIHSNLYPKLSGPYIALEEIRFNQIAQNREFYRRDIAKQINDRTKAKSDKLPSSAQSLKYIDQGNIINERNTVKQQKLAEQSEQERLAKLAAEQAEQQQHAKLPAKQSEQ